MAFLTLCDQISATSLSRSKYHTFRLTTQDGFVVFVVECKLATLALGLREMADAKASSNVFSSGSIVGLLLVVGTKLVIVSSLYCPCRLFLVFTGKYSQLHSWSSLFQAITTREWSAPACTTSSTCYVVAARTPAMLRMHAIPPHGHKHAEYTV